MPKFHRFTAPSYYGAPSLGAPPLGVVTFEGVDYDLFNVVTAGTGGGGSSFMDGYKTVGPNVGTYAVAFGEDASSSNANRGFRALAENTDVLDDLMHRDIALPLVTSLATSDGTATYGSAVLPIDTFIGSSPTYSLDDLFSIVDNNDREIIDPATYAKVTVTGISEAIGGGFSTGALTLTFSQNVPNGVQFKIYYSSRGNLATMPVDSLSYIRVRGAEEVSAEVQRVLAELHGPGYLWNDSWLFNIDDLYGLLNSTSGSGVDRIAETPTLVSLASVPLPAGVLDGSYRVVPGYGLYRWASSGPSPTTWKSVAGTTVEGGFWVHNLQQLMGVNDGIPEIDAYGLLDSPLKTAKEVVTIAGLTLESLTGVVDGDLRLVTDTEFAGFYRYQAAALPTPSVPYWTVRDGAGSVGSWVHVMKDLIGTPEGLATLDASTVLTEKIRKVIAYASTSNLELEPTGSQLPGNGEELRAVTNAGNDVLDVDRLNKGIYFWDDSSTALANAPWIITPSSSPAAGRWVNAIYGLWGTPNGLARLNSSQRVREFPLDTALHLFEFKNDLSWAGPTYSNTGYLTVASGANYTAPMGTLKNGDIIVCEAIVDIRKFAGGAGLFVYAGIELIILSPGTTYGGPPDPTPLNGPGVNDLDEYFTDNGTFTRGVLRLVHLVSTAPTLGQFTVNLKCKVDAGATGLINAHSLSIRVIRP